RIHVVEPSEHQVIFDAWATAIELPPTSWGDRKRDKRTQDNVRDRGDPQSKALLGGDRTETARRGCQR
ncbi:unnamed protein product, partial [Durusdinium trenchii]